MTRLRKTLFLSEAKEVNVLVNIFDNVYDCNVIGQERRKYQAEYIFYSRTGSAKWRQDTTYFNDHEEVKDRFKKAGYLIK